MAGNDATTTELFPGWSSVVHQPADEPEERDLPSTVDITAFSSGLSVEHNNTPQINANSDSESDSEADSSVSYLLKTCNLKMLDLYPHKMKLIWFYYFRTLALMPHNHVVSQIHQILIVQHQAKNHLREV